MSNRLETALFDLGARIEYPDTPPLAPVLPTPSRRRPWSRWRVLAVVIAALVVVVLVFPGTRQAMADLFGIGSVQIDVIDSLPEAAAVREPSGQNVSLEEAEGLVEYAILTPVRSPDVVYVDLTVPGGMVTLGYGESRLYITQIPAEVDGEAVRKLVLPETEVVPVTVGDEPGFWIEGSGHALVIIDREGGIVEDSARLAADTLLFTDDGLTVRIEGQMSLDQAMAIASQLD